MKQPTHNRPRVFLGGPTILTVLLVLCFASFALLSLSRAAADYRYSARAAQTVSDFYAADSRAHQLLSAAQDAFALPPAACGTALSDALTADDCTATYDDDAQRLALSVPAASQGTLEICLRLSPDDNGGTRYTVQRWQLVPEDPAAAPQNMPIYSPDDPESE